MFLLTKQEVNITLVPSTKDQQDSVIGFGIIAESKA